MNNCKKVAIRKSVLISFWIVLVVCAGIAGCIQNGTRSDALRPGKLDGLPAEVAEGKFKQGLSAIYFHDKYGHIDEIPRSQKGIKKFGRPGAPILKLDNAFGRGHVFDSGRSQEVGILMQGYIHLDKPGIYYFQAKSNDGFQLVIDGNVVVSDPDVHADKLSDPGQFRVVRGGMFPVEIRYFQRKGTAALHLYWKQPGASFFKIVPAGAYSHSGK